MSTTRGVAAVTGASGYLGSALTQGLEHDGWRVRRLARTPAPGDSSARHFELGGPVPPELLSGVDLLVHAAYDMGLTRRADIWRVNVRGTERLLAAAGRAGVRRTIVLSSMSAYQGTRQIYGRAKLAIEAETQAVGGLVVRPGLVYGDRPGGMAGALHRMTALPVVPLVGGDARQYPVHEDDFVRAMVTLASADPWPPTDGPIGVAAADPVPFRSLLESLAGADGKQCRFVPVPWQAVYWLLRTAELARLPLPFRADSLLGLVRSAPGVPGADRLAELGIELRPFAPAGAHAR